MMTWLLANLGTIVVGGILFLIILLIVRSMVNKKKNQSGGCGCGCGGCASSEICHGHKDDK